MFIAEHRIQDVHYRIYDTQHAGCRIVLQEMLITGCRIRNRGYRIFLQDYRIHNAGHIKYITKYRIYNTGYRIHITGL